MEELPELVISRIADYLHPVDVARWSMTCKRFHRELPSFLVIKGDNFYIRGIVHGLHTWPDTPEHYFDSPPLKGPVKKMFISCVWKDQGWGNQKGDVFITLMRGKEEIATKYKPLGIAPHNYTADSTVLAYHSILSESREGDHYKFTRNAGGGGGHKLLVKNYRVVVQYCCNYN